MDGILLDKQYTVKGTKPGCSHCKCEWNTINKTSKYAHFGSKEIAKRDVKFHGVARNTPDFRVMKNL